MKSIGVTLQRTLQKTAKRNIAQYPAKLSNIFDRTQNTEHKQCNIRIAMQHQGREQFNFRTEDIRKQNTKNQNRKQKTLQQKTLQHYNNKNKKSHLHIKNLNI